MTENLLTTAEACALLGVSRATLFRGILEGRIPAVRVSPRCLRFSRTAVLAALGGAA